MRCDDGMHSVGCGVDDSEAVIKDTAEAAWEAAQLNVDPGDWKHTFEVAEKRSFNR